MFFNPCLFPDAAVWHGFISDRESLLCGDYKNVIEEMAKLAEKERIDLFAVGSEYAGSLSNDAAWRFVIAEVGKVFSRKTTYVGNHDTFMQRKFWDALDVICVSAYFILIKDHQNFRRSPGMQETVALWEREARLLNE